MASILGERQTRRYHVLLIKVYQNCPWLHLNKLGCVMKHMIYWVIALQIPCYMCECTYAPNCAVKFDGTTDIVCICVTMEEVAQLVANKVIVQNIRLQGALSCFIL